MYKGIKMINLSKTSYCTGLQCPKILWLDKNKSEEKDLSEGSEERLNTGIKVGELARSYFGLYGLVPYSENFNEMLAETQRLLTAKTPVICEASFSGKDGFCRVDILLCSGGSVEIVEVKSTASVKNEHFDDMAYQYHILSNCGLQVNKVSLMHINSQYERLGELNIQQLFAVEDCTKEVKEKQKETSANIRKIREIAGSESEPDIPVGPHCDNPYPCAYKQYCGWQTDQEPVTDYSQPPIIDIPKIKAFLETLHYPLYFLDFETFNEVIPSMDHQRPYKQIPCQYSIHIQAKEGAEPDHLEFLAEPGADFRRAIAEKLCADIPQDVCVIAYHMSTEKGFIKDLANLFPDLAPHLMTIHDNVKDLIVPFRQLAWRSPAQEGSNSLKAVLPAMFPNNPDLDYSKLDLIHNGLEAAEAFADLPNRPPEEQKRIRTALLAYCRLDTLAMVKILEKLQETIRQG